MRVKKWGRLDVFRTFDWGKLVENLPLGFLKIGMIKETTKEKYSLTHEIRDPLII